MDHVFLGRQGLFKKLGAFSAATGLKTRFWFLVSGMGLTRTATSVRFGGFAMTGAFLESPIKIKPDQREPVQRFSDRCGQLEYDQFI